MNYPLWTARENTTTLGRVMNHMERSGNTAEVPRHREPSLERLALTATTYIGSPVSIVLHTLFFVLIFGLGWLGYSFEQILLMLTTVVSLEAIYLSIFIQLTVNRQARHVEAISKDIDDIQEDVEDIQEDAKEISEDVEDIHGNIEEIKEDVEDLTEGLEDDEWEEVPVPTPTAQGNNEKLTRIEGALEELLREVRTLKR